MRRMRYRAWIVGLLMAVGIGCGAEVFPVGTPIFEKPDSQGKLLFVLTQAQELERTGENRTVFFAQHPLAAYHEFIGVRLAQDKVGYAVPSYAVFMDPAGGAPRWQNRTAIPLWRYWAAAVTLGLLGWCLWQWRRLSRATILTERQEFWLFAAGLLLLRQGLLLVFVTGIGGGVDNVVCSAADEPGYLQVGWDILHGSWTGPWRYPIGLGTLLYLPLLAITGGREYYDLAIGVSYLSGLVFSPLMIVLAFAVLRKIGLSNRQAGAAALLWCVGAFVHHYIPNWEEPDQWFISMLTPPALNPGFAYYNELIAAGFNGMSDTFSTMLVLTTMGLTLWLPRKLYAFAVVGGVFALCCSIRLNNIFFAPVLAYLLYCRHEAALRELRYLAAAFGLGAGCYLLLLLPQFWVNSHQFGSPFTFSYVLHYADWKPGTRPADGFRLATVFSSRNVLFLIGSNFAVMAAGIAALLTMRDRRRRTLLVWWAVPVIWFFFGYSHTFCDGVRFILTAYPALLGAVAGLEMWRREGGAKCSLLAASALLIGCAVLPYGTDFPAGNTLNALCGEMVWRVVLTAAGLAVAWYFWRHKDRQAAGFIGIFAVLCAISSSWLLAWLLLALLLRAVWDTVRDVFRRGATPR